MPDDPIGSVRVDITADYSKFAEGVKNAESQASQAGAKIAAAFTSGVSPAVSLTEATNRLKAAQAALTNEGAKMLAQVQATSPGYAAAQSAMAELNAELAAAQEGFAAATAAQQEMVAAEKATAQAASEAAAAKQAEAAAVQASAEAARVDTVVEELLGSATRTSAAAFDQQAASALRAAGAIASGSTAGTAAAAASLRSAAATTAAAGAANAYAGSVGANAQIAALASQANAQLAAAMTTAGASTLSAAQAQELLASSTAAGTATLNAEASGIASSTAALGANATAALRASAAQREMVTTAQAMAAAYRAQQEAATSSLGGVMAGAHQAQKDLEGVGEAAETTTYRMGHLFLVLMAVRSAIGALDKIREDEVHLLHLSQATGIAAQSLAQFQAAISAAGGDGDKFGAVLLKLSQSIEQGERGVARMSDELHRLGVTSKNPIEAFYQIADTLHNTSDKSEALAASARVLGASEEDLIGIMNSGSAVLRQYYAESENLGKARAAAIAAAVEQTRVEHELKAALEEITVGSLPLLTTALKVVATIFSGLNIVVKLVASTILGAFEGATDAAKNFGIVLSDLAHGKWDMLRIDAAAALDGIRDDFRKFTKDVETRTGESVKFISDLWSKSSPKETPGANKPFPKPAQKADHGPEQELRHQYQEQLADLKADHEVTIQEELDFWTKRYAIVQQKGAAFADLAREIHRSIGSLKQQEFKQEGREYNKADTENYKEIEQQIKEAQEAAVEAGGHPAKVKLDKLIDLTSSDNGISADTYRKLFDQIPAAQKEADKEATADLKRFLAEQDQAWLESGNRTAKQIKARAESARAALEELRPFFVGMDALIDAETAKIIAANKRIEADKLRVADLVASNQQQGGQSDIQSRRIALESEYALQVTHTYQEQIAYQQQLAALDAEGLVLKRNKADADYRAAVALGDEVKIQEALNEQAAAGAAIDLQAQKAAADLAKLKQSTSFSGQVAAGLTQDAQSAVSRLSQGIATLATQTKGWGQQFKTILKDIEKSIVETFANAALKQGLNALMGATKPQSTGGAATGGAAAAGTGAVVAALAANTAATTADAATTTAHSGIMATHLGVMITHTGTMIANTAAVIAHTIAVVAATLATWALAAIEAIKTFFGFAEGGDPDPNAPFIAGEKGPELIHPKGRALTVVTADKTRQLLAAAQQGIGNFQIPQGILDVPRVAPGATFSASQAQQISNSTAGSVTNQNTGRIGDSHFNIYGVNNPREIMRQIADFEKRQTGKYSPMNS